jgi:hypothetical protein
LEKKLVFSVSASAATIGFLLVAIYTSVFLADGTGLGFEVSFHTIDPALPLP